MVKKIQKLGALALSLFFLGMIYWLIPAPGILGGESMEDQKISVDSPLTLFFTQWMDQESLVKAVRFSSPLPGRWDWEGRSAARFWPEKPFQIGDRIQLTVEIKAKSFWGKSIKTPLNLSYVVTGPPFVEFWKADAAQGKITVVFDRPMEETQKIDPMLILDPSAEGSARWRAPRVLEWRTAGLALSALYNVKIPAGLKAKGGGETNADFKFEFRTPSLQVIASDPSAGAREVQETQEIILTFNQAVELDSVKPGLTALLFPSNDLEAEKNQREDGFFNTDVTYGLDQSTLVFKPAFPYQADQEYRFLLKKLLPLTGAVPMENEFELRFKTGAPSLDPEMAWNETERPPIFELSLSGSSDGDLAIELCSVPRKEFLELVQRFSWQNYECKTSPKTTVTHKASASAIRLDLESLLEEPLRKGTYILSVTNGKTRITNAFAIGETELFLRRSGRDLLLWAADRSIGAPVENLSITIFSYNGEELAKGKTSPEGLYEWKEKAEDGIIVIGENATRWVFLSDLKARETSDTPRLYFLTDQAGYSSGDRFYFQGLVRRMQTAGLSLPEKAKIRLALETSAGESIVPLSPTLGRFGAFYGEGKIPEGIPAGLYKIKTEIAESGEIFLFETPFKVHEPAVFAASKKNVLNFKPVKETLHLNPTSRWISAGEEWGVDLEVRSSESRAPEGKKVKLHLKGKGVDVKKTILTGRAPKRVPFSFPKEAEGNYVLAAESEGEDGSPLKSEIQVFAVGKKFRPEEPLLLPDQNEYLVGGKARLLLMAPPNLPLLVTYEGRRLFHREVVTMESSSKPLEIILDETMLPELLVTVSYFDLKENRFKTKTVSLPINFMEKAIQITAVQQRNETAKNNEITMEIKTTDYQGRPLQGQLTLIAMNPIETVADPLDYFYRGTPEEIAPFDSFYFKTGLKTSETGQTVFSIPLPGHFLKGKLTVIAASGTDRFGKTEIPIISPQPLGITPVLPSFARKGDELLVEASFLNLRDQELKTSVELIAEGIEIKNRPKQNLILAPQEEKKMEWHVRVTGNGPPILPLAFRTPLTFAAASLPVASRPLRFYSLDEIIKALAQAVIREEIEEAETLKKELESFAMPSGGYRLTRSAKESDPLWTAYALLLTRKKSDETYRILWNALEEKNLSDDEKVLVIGALGEAGELDTRLTLDFVQKRAELSESSQGFLLLTLKNLVQAGQKSLEPFIERLKSEIASAATEGKKMNSVILFALSRVSPENPLLKGLKIPPGPIPPEITEATTQSQSLVITREFPSEALKKREKAEGVIYFIAPRPIRYAKMEMPLPAGLKPVSFEPKIENSFYQMDPDRLVMLAPELPAGVYEIPYVLEAVYPGRYFMPSASVFSLVSPKEHGSTPEGWVEVKE